MTGDDDALASYLDPAGADALLSWAALTDRQVRPVAERWLNGVYTGATIVPVLVTDANGANLLIVKRHRRGQTADQGTHAQAFADAPPAFLPRLVAEPFAALPTRDGGAVTLHYLGGSGDGWQPMRSLTTPMKARAIAVVTQALLNDWNPAIRIVRSKMVSFLADEREAATSLRESELAIRGLGGSAWLRTADGVTRPDPLHLLGEASLLRGVPVDVAVGRVHGDLHHHNVLFRVVRDRVDPGAFVLVDLRTYGPDQPVSRDLVTLLLSVTSDLLDDLSSAQQQTLLAVFVRPEGSVPEVLPPGVKDLVDAVWRTAADRLRPFSAGIWHRQYLLALVVHSLAFTTFEDLGPARRWWYLRLAAHAASELLLVLKQPTTPQDSTPLTNPFTAAHAVADVEPRPDGLPDQPMVPPAADRASRNGRHHTYSGTTKVEVCRRLVADWRELADLLGVPQHDTARFRWGEEPRGLGEWLEQRARLDELIGSLRQLGRDDLVLILEADQG